MWFQCVRQRRWASCTTKLLASFPSLCSKVCFPRARNHLWTIFWAWPSLDNQKWGENKNVIMKTYHLDHYWPFLLLLPGLKILLLRICTLLKNPHTSIIISFLLHIKIRQKRVIMWICLQIDTYGFLLPHVIKYVLSIG